MAGRRPDRAATCGGNRPLGGRLSTTLDAFRGVVRPGCLLRMLDLAGLNRCRR